RSYVETQIADPKDAISISLKTSTVDPIIASFKIINSDKKRDSMLVDVTNFISKDNNFTGLPSEMKTKAKLGAMLDDRSFVDTVRAFPMNIELKTTRTYSASNSVMTASTSGSATLGLNTSIVILPETPMRKRIWDDRVGYFVNRFTLFSDKEQKTENESFISRFRLEPKNLKAYMKGQLVEPIKQIVYYIDPGTPKKWVPYLIAGVNDWNKAFEAAGFKNAIVAKEWPNDSRMSLEDARYNVLRYLPAEIENAYGPRIVDPRSGEIIETHICWYHNVMKLLKEWYMIQCGPNDKGAQTMKFDDELMGELIRFVSSHEVGHTLGLRHNMGASFATPVENLRNKEWVEKHGHTVSIMDYARFNYVAQPEDNISRKGLFPRINDYDLWAIKWGYSYRPEFKNEYEERDALKKETTKVLTDNRKLWFGGEGRNEDPRSQIEDLSDNNMKASDYGVKNLKRVIAGLPQWTKQENDDYSDLSDMYKAVLGQFKRYLGHVTKNIGTKYINNMPGMVPFQPTPAARQQEAVDYISRQVFDAPLWLYPEEIVNKVGIDASKDIISRQDQVLTTIMSPGILTNIYNAYASSEKNYNPATYLDDLFKAVWKPLNNPVERKNIYRRALQRSYVDRLSSLITSTSNEKGAVSLKANNTDMLLYVVDHLNKVEDYVKKNASAATTKGVNSLHYKELLNTIKVLKDKREGKNQ
ncbi:MAG: zinc-dependent metalloprotease, partial [Prevotella nanceiensis]|nr:zinc-dependent metalloprotease [Hoylesella nanceiensis]